MTFTKIFKNEEIHQLGNKLYTMYSLYSGIFIDNKDELIEKDVIIFFFKFFLNYFLNYFLNIIIQANIYGLKAHKNLSDLDFSKIFEENLSKKIIKYYNIENSSSILIVVKCENEEYFIFFYFILFSFILFLIKYIYFRVKSNFENAMNNCNNLFTYHNVDKLRELLKEENDKKNEKKNFN